MFPPSPDTPMSVSRQANRCQASLKSAATCPSVAPSKRFSCWRNVAWRGSGKAKSGISRCGEEVLCCPTSGQAPKELPREGRPLTRRVRGILEGTATAGEPLWAGCAGSRGVLGTALPLSPCDLWYCRASEALWKDEHGRSGYG